MDQLTFNSVTRSTVDKNNTVRSMTVDLWMVNLFLKSAPVGYVGQCMRIETNDMNEVAK